MVREVVYATVSITTPLYKPPRCLACPRTRIPWCRFSFHHRFIGGCFYVDIRVVKDEKVARGREEIEQAAAANQERGTDLWKRGAGLTDADLSGANISEEQLAMCKSLEGATMPDGSKHP